MPITGIQVTVKAGGTPTTMTAEAMAGSGTTWQVTSTTKRIIDPDTSWTVYDNAIAVLAADIVSLNYFTGTVVFTGSKTGPITITGKYIPMTSIAGAHAIKMSGSVDLLEDTEFTDTYRGFTAGLKTLTGDLEVYANLTEDLGGGDSFLDILSDGTPVMLQVAFNTVLWTFWALVESGDTDADVEALHQGSLTYTLLPRVSANGDTLTYSRTA